MRLIIQGTIPRVPPYSVLPMKVGLNLFLYSIFGCILATEFDCRGSAVFTIQDKTI